MALGINFHGFSSVVGCLRSALEPPWKSWRRLGPSWVRLGLSEKRLGNHLGNLFGRLGTS